MRSEYLFAAFLTAVALERVYELRLSNRNAAWAFARGGREVGQRHYRVMTALHSSFFVAVLAEVFLLERPFPGALGVAALVTTLVTQALRYWAITTLKERWNTRVIVLPETQPVTGGPYRFLRHPNYLAVVLELFALPLIHGAWLSAIAFTVANAALLSVRIRAEEAALGSLYRQAFAGRPRLLPSLPGSSTDVR